MKNIKPLRLIVFLVSVIALARFFEAGRIIADEQMFAHLGMSIVSLFIFICTLLLMGYWIYIEEKEKNNLKVKFGLYEWIYKRVGGKET